MLRDVGAHPYLETQLQDESVSLLRQVHHEKQEQEWGGGSEEKKEGWLSLFIFPLSNIISRIFKVISYYKHC